ncbi:hypothetical protein K523DRAFT_310750 [Schizophyllum commune Tattone D]|nr:hypothetical protein K523DRAFT_310750 [Schizophyllum commune Tattone D]
MADFDSRDVNNGFRPYPSARQSTPTASAYDRPQAHPGYPTGGEAPSSGVVRHQRAGYLVRHAQPRAEGPAIADVASSAQVKELMEKVDKAQEDIQVIMAFIKNHWVVSDALHVALSQVVSYFASKPTHSPAKILSASVKYVLEHPSEYELERTGPVIQGAIRLHIKDKLLNARKNKVRTLVFRSTETKTALDLMAAQIISKYWIDPKPKKSNITKEAKAYFALMREIAAPRAGKKNPRGADTGFWKALGSRLYELYVEHGRDRTSDGWRGWQDEIILKDNEKYQGTATPDLGEEDSDDDDDA